MPLRRRADQWTTAPVNPLGDLPLGNQPKGR